jgi:hypothetical protein
MNHATIEVSGLLSVSRPTLGCSDCGTREPGRNINQLLSAACFSKLHSSSTS